MSRYYTRKLAHEIINKFPVKELDSFPLESSDTTFLEYKNDHIEIIKAKNTHALYIRVFYPLTEHYNSIIYVNDDGVCFRYHIESINFEAYAEKLLQKRKTIAFQEWYDLYMLDYKLTQEMNKLFNKLAINKEV